MQLADTENKYAWCGIGNAMEYAFLEQYGAELGLSFNPDKEGNKFTHDLTMACDRPADLKTQQTPFYTAGRYGFNPQTTMTLNLKDVERYSELYPSIVIYFWQRFTDSNLYGHAIHAVDSVYRISLDKILSLIEGQVLPVHHYQKRLDDVVNAQSSYLLDTAMMQRVA